MSAAALPLLVLGVGNPLRGDDAVGERVIAELRDGRERGTIDLPPEVSLVAAGTPGPELLPWLAEASGVVIVDAAVGGEAPGTVTVWRDAATIGHPLGRGVDDLLATARLARSLPAAVSLVGVEAGTLEPGAGLGREVDAALPAAVAATVAEIARLRRVAGAMNTLEVRA